MSVSPLKAALLVMDFQAAMLGYVSTEVSSALVAKGKQAIEHARSHNIPVIYVRVGFRQGCPEIGEFSCKSFAEGKSRFEKMDMEEWLKLHPDLGALESEVIVTKRRISAFTGSDLEVILRAYDTRHLVLAGFSTSGVLLSTVCEAADKDYKLTILSDGCADSDQELHQTLLTKVFPKRAAVVTVDQWTSSHEDGVSFPPIKINA